MTCTNLDVQNRRDMTTVLGFGGKVTPGFGVAAAAMLTVNVAFAFGLFPPASATNSGATPMGNSCQVNVQMRKEPAAPAIPF